MLRRLIFVDEEVSFENEIDDHIAAELEILTHLYMYFIICIENGNSLIFNHLTYFISND